MRYKYLEFAERIEREALTYGQINRNLNQSVYTEEINLEDYVLILSHIRKDNKSRHTELTQVFPPIENNKLAIIKYKRGRPYDIIIKESKGGTWEKQLEEYFSSRISVAICRALEKSLEIALK